MDTKSLIKWVLIYLVIALVVYGAIYYAFFYKKESSYTNNYTNNNINKPVEQQQAVGASTVFAVISNFQFQPASLTVNKGDTVIWTNEDSMGHTVTGDNGGPNSPTLQKGQIYNYTFNKAGTFNYHCSIHPNMKATIIVK